MKIKYSKVNEKKSTKRVLSQRRRWEKSFLRCNSSTSLGEVIDELIQAMGAKDIIAEQDAITKWKQVVGERIAEQTEAKSIKNGILKVKVGNQVWRQELTYMKDDIMQRLNIALDGKFVSEIIFS